MEEDDEEDEDEEEKVKDEEPCTSAKADVRETASNLSTIQISFHMFH